MAELSNVQKAINKIRAERGRPPLYGNSSSSSSSGSSSGRGSSSYSSSSQPNYQEHINAAGGAQNYANLINQKTQAGQQLQDQAAANAFMAANPQYFNNAPSINSTYGSSNSSSPSLGYQEHINAAGGAQNYANTINQKLQAGERLQDQDAASKFIRDNPQYFNNYQQHVTAAGNEQGYANLINQKLSSGQTIDDPVAANAFMAANPQYFNQGRYNPAITNDFNQFIEQADPADANDYRVKYNEYTDLTDSVNRMQDFYDNLLRQTTQLQGAYADKANALDKDLTNKMNETLQFINTQYGVDGEQRKQIEDYYSNMSKVIASQNAVNQGEITAQAQASGASAGAIRNARQAATQGANEQYLKIQQNHLQNLDQVAQTFAQYRNEFVKQYGDVKSQLVLDTYKQLTDALNSINTARMNAAAKIEESYINRKNQELEAQRNRELQASTIVPGTSGTNVIPPTRSIPDGYTPTSYKIDGTYPVYQNANGKYVYLKDGYFIDVGGSRSGGAEALANANFSNRFSGLLN